MNAVALRDFKIEHLFSDQGWAMLLDMGNEFFLKYIRIFFSNMFGGYNDEFFTVRSYVGKEIVLNETILAEIFHIPYDGERVYELKTY